MKCLRQRRYIYSNREEEIFIWRRSIKANFPTLNFTRVLQEKVWNHYLENKKELVTTSNGEPELSSINSSSRAYVT